MLKAVLSRLGYTAATLAVLVGIASGVVFVVIAFVIVTAVIFAGSTGAAHHRFVSHFLPIAYFAEGALVAGGALALLNAIVRPRPFWLMPMLAAAALGGLFLVVRPSVGERVADLAVPVMTAMLKFGRAGQEDEKAAAVAFVKSQQAVAHAVGSGFQADVASMKLTDGKAVEYDISVRGQKTAYAIVRVSRARGRVDFSLACVTPLYIGQRDPFKDSCAQ